MAPDTRPARTPLPRGVRSRGVVGIPPRPSIDVSAGQRPAHRKRPRDGCNRPGLWPNALGVRRVRVYMRRSSRHPHRLQPPPPCRRRRLRRLSGQRARILAAALCAQPQVSRPPPRHPRVSRNVQERVPLPGVQGGPSVPYALLLREAPSPGDPADAQGHPPNLRSLRRRVSSSEGLRTSGPCQVLLCPVPQSSKPGHRPIGATLAAPCSQVSWPPRCREARCEGCGWLDRR